MTLNGIVDRIPIKRVAAADGMAVTADVWNQAHAYHSYIQAAHASAGMGAAILTGLQVTADSPPGQNIHVAPGVAVDHHGQTIVIPKPQAYNLRDQEGLIYLLLTYSESTPRVDANAEGADAPRFVHTGYTLEAKTRLPDAPYVELARIKRPDHAQPVKNAAIAELPALSELDLRFRRQVTPPARLPLLLPIRILDAQVAAEHTQGWSNLARELRHQRHWPVWSEQIASLETDLSAYPLLCMTAQQTFDLARG
ncbi:MAG: hypothetical protein KDE46_20740, partial [Caldilineaceae bacterium]|nr:hypothetical protein [Caldilineaceae bacterium]